MEMAGLLGVSLRTVVTLETPPRSGGGGLAPRTVRAWGRLRAAWKVTRDAGETEPVPAALAPLDRILKGES